MEGIDFKNVISAAELVQLQWRPHGWVLPQMIPQGGITLLAGETSSGKSLLALDLALGLASGRGKAWDMEFGDREKTADSSWVIGDMETTVDSSWVIGDREKTADKKIELQNPSVDDTNTVEQTRPVPYNVQLKDPSQAQDDNPHRVRYFCGDADPNLVAERVIRLCRGYPDGNKGMGIAVPDGLDLDFAAHAFSDPQSFTWLQKEVMRQGYQLLIFDGLAQYLPGMADGSASTVGAFLRGLRQLASQTGVSVVLIHQFNKRLASRLNKWGLPTSQGEERVRGSSELLAGVDSVLLLSRPEAMKLGGRGRAVLKVVKNRLGQAGARLQFTIVDGDASLHLLFERLGQEAQPKPRRLVDAAFDEMMRILMAQDERKFDRAELSKLLGDRMSLPAASMLNEAFSLLGKDERVRVERDETSKKRYSWAQPGTGALESKVYGLPPAMALDVASSYLLSKARLSLAEQQMEAMQAKGKTTELLGQLADLLRRGDEGADLPPS